ncbi:enoyl-CoA hydratase/isomerase family protein [Sphingopyxis granuli]|uniref:enoyl-CoA hydratase/isomerase family protein n=1 Tax=Sphingopyxis granuli TaxID=267128 RepID=UPI001BB08D86|nr:enoyl-CoA hydratase/isomerase family protein [Sphingopyxis granuli]QUM73985.1 enoyl-CoA hydratase/isomerase family protein [Sphingopyxis granuli]
MQQARPIRIERSGAIATIILDRPARANTITMQLTVDFNDALDELEADREIACILVTGAGEKHFCGGADLREIEDMITEEGVTGDPRRDFVSHIEAVAKPVIAVINGAAMGGGCEIALACDFRIMVDDAKIGLPEIRFGALPGAGGTQRLPRLVGLAKAKELILLGGSLSAREALAVGLVTAVASREALDRCVEDLVGQLVGKAPYALAAGKALLNRSLDLPLAEGLAIERRVVRDMGSKEERDDFRERSMTNDAVYAGIFSPQKTTAR